MATARQLEHHPVAKLYETDFLSWTGAQAEALRSRQVDALDWENLLEEVESIGASQRRESRSRLTILLMHLIKWTWQPERRSTSWKLTILEQRREIESLLDQSPSLKPAIPEVLEKSWADACEAAAIETSLRIETFPQICPWDSQTQVVTKDWWPEAQNDQV